MGFVGLMVVSVLLLCGVVYDVSAGVLWLLVTFVT